jgi:predicted transcriptional regulator
MTITIELPDDLAKRLVSLPQASANLHAFAVAALSEAADVAENEAYADEESPPEVIEALREGLADVQAGRTLSLEEADVQFESLLTAARARVREQIREHGHPVRVTGPPRSV